MSLKINTVKIGIIDSGIDISHTQLTRYLKKGTYIDNEFHHHQGFNDDIGHGTACADLISRIFEPGEIEFYIYKIFDSSVTTTIGRFKAAIQSAIDDNIDLLNCSIGTIDPDAKIELFDTVQYAINSGIILVCAWNDENITTWPANFSGVISVKSGEIKSQDEWGWEENLRDHVVFRGSKQRVKWRDGQHVFIAGSSFATALCTRRIAKYLSVNATEKHVNIVKSYLKENASVVTIQNNAPSEIIKWNSFYTRFKKVGIYPFHKESHGFVRYNKNLNFSIEWIADFKKSKAAGKFTDEVLENCNEHYLIHTGLPKNKGTIDGLIIGYLDKASSAQRKNLLEEALEYSIENEINVFSYLPPDNLSEWQARFKQNGLWLEIPIITYNNTVEILQSVKEKPVFDTPIIGVFGTSAKQGKFTLQLELRYQLLRRGYKVGQIGTEHQSGCFGFDFTFPSGYGYNQSLDIPLDFHIPLLRRVLSELDKGQNDVIISGPQSGLLSIDPYSYDNIFSQLYLTALVPDYIILVSNEFDESEFVSRITKYIEAVVGHSKILNICFSDFKNQKNKIVSRILNFLEIPVV